MRGDVTRTLRCVYSLARRRSMGTVIIVRRSTVISCDVVTRLSGGRACVVRWLRCGGGDGGVAPFMPTVSQSVGPGRVRPRDRSRLVFLSAVAAAVATAWAPVVDRHNLRHGRSTGVPRNRYRRIYRAIAVQCAASSRFIFSIVCSLWNFSYFILQCLYVCTRSQSKLHRLLLS